MSKSSLTLCGFALLLAVVPDHAQNPCDVNVDGFVNAVDVQLATNMYLGVTACTVNIAGPGVCTSQVVQTIISTVLGGTCFLHYATLNWTPSPSPGIVGYNVYRSATSGGPYAKLTSSLVAPLTFTDTTVLAGQTYYYVATAVDTTNTESAYSTEAAVVVPTP
jgi:hypothetical protein